jgi:hypothetical protein
LAGALCLLFDEAEPRRAAFLPASGERAFFLHNCLLPSSLFLLPSSLFLLPSSFSLPQSQQMLQIVAKIQENQI